MSRTLLKEESIQSITPYFLNLCLTKSIKNTTCKQAFSVKGPNLECLHIVRCTIYSQVYCLYTQTPETKRKKLDDSGETRISIGYIEESITHSFYNTLNN